MRVGVVGIYHEANTFSPGTVSIEDFQAFDWYVGEQIVTKLGDSNTEIAAAIAELSALGHDAVPLFYAASEELMPISSEAELGLWSVIHEALIAAGELDGVVAIVHGAAVGQTHLDYDGWWLSQLRQTLGQAKPIVMTLDPHANVSDTMASAVNAAVAYRNNPHTDQRQTGQAAARLIDRLLGGQRLTLASCPIPIALSIERHNTADEPIAGWRAEGDRLEAETPGVVSTSLCMGYPYGDVPEMGMSVQVVADSAVCDPKPVAEAWAAMIWETRERGRPSLVSATEAVERTAEFLRDPALSKPLGLLDMGDNIGGGGNADGTTLGHALRDAGITRSFIALHAPEAYAACLQAGVGGCVDLEIGGELDERGPFRVTGTIERLTDGTYHDPTPLPDGRTHYQDGPDALVRCDDGFHVQVCRQRVFPVSLGQLAHLGLTPNDFDALILKGVQAPVAAYGPVCRTTIRVNTPGLTYADLTDWPYQNRRQPMFPFE